MIEETQLYYDKESQSYSRKRYHGALISYTQYVFRKRLALFLNLFNRVLKDDKAVSVFEIGCADGIVLKSLRQHFGDKVGDMIGLDVSPAMIREAQDSNSDKKTSYLLRGHESDQKYDVVVELGVHVDKLRDEIAYVKSHLAADGYVFYSAAGRHSLHARFKRRDDPYVNDYLSYKKTEELLTGEFEIVDSVAYGLFVPKLWAVPALGRFIQPVVDFLVRPFNSSLFHEKMYLLKSRNKPE